MLTRGGRQMPSRGPPCCGIWDSIFPEFILHAGSALKSWFCDFLTSCMRQLTFPKIWRRALVVAIAKPEKPKELSTYISSVCPLENPRETHLRSCRNNHRPTAPTGAGGLPTREFGCRSGHPVDTGHRG